MASRSEPLYISLSMAGTYIHLLSIRQQARPEGRGRVRLRERDCGMYSIGFLLTPERLESAKHTLIRSRFINVRKRESAT